MRINRRELIPVSSIDSMAAAGCKFWWEDKQVSAAQLKKFLNTVAFVQECTSTAAKIRCVTTGKIYDKQSDAARDLGIDPAQVSDSIKTGRIRSGYLFEKVNI